MTALEIHIERVDDIPLLMAQQHKMGIPQVLDQIIHSHGNRQGLSIGQVVQIWLNYVLSEGDHRMMVVEAWVSSKLTLLSALVGEAVNAKDFTDDRLADVLKALSDEETWEQIEAQLGQHLIRVYHLENAPIRLDSTSVCGHHEVEGEGLFQYGYSKDHRPDLAQFKVMLGTLDPLGIPLVSLMPSGEESDDGFQPCNAAKRLSGKAVIYMWATAS